jgi:hypothetical protein
MYILLRNFEKKTGYVSQCENWKHTTVFHHVEPCSNFSLLWSLIVFLFFAYLYIVDRLD